MKKITLYHLTDLKNITSIIEKGLDINFSKNQRNPFVWFDQRVTFTLTKHIMKKHNLKPHEVLVCEIFEYEHFFIKHILSVCSEGYALKTKRNIKPVSYITINNFLEI